MEYNHIIRIQCSDRKGLIAAITDVVQAHDLNIVVMKEYVEAATNYFFTRLEVSGALGIPALQQALQQKLPPDAVVAIRPRQKKDILILVTKEHHCLGDLLVRHYFNELEANIKAVIGNYDHLQSFVEKFNIPFHYVDHGQGDREAFEKNLLEVIGMYTPGYLVLAKFMRILSPQLVARFENRIINIHHSFLPAFIGANPYRQAFERGVKLIGATAHFVNNNLDEGPIITQKIIPVDHEYDVKGMIAAGHEIEKSVLADALKLVLEDRIFVSGNKTIVFD